MGAEEINWGKKRVGERKDWEKRGERDARREGRGGEKGKKWKERGCGTEQKERETENRKWERKKTERGTGKSKESESERIGNRRDREMGRKKGE